MSTCTFSPSFGFTLSAPFCLKVASGKALGSTESRPGRRLGVGGPPSPGVGLPSVTAADQARGLSRLPEARAPDIPDMGLSPPAGLWRAVAAPSPRASDEAGVFSVGRAEIVSTRGHEGVFAAARCWPAAEAEGSGAHDSWLSPATLRGPDFLDCVPVASPTGCALAWVLVWCGFSGRRRAFALRFVLVALIPAGRSVGASCPVWTPGTTPPGTKRSAVAERADIAAASHEHLLHAEGVASQQQPHPGSRETVTMRRRVLMPQSDTEADGGSEPRRGTNRWQHTACRLTMARNPWLQLAALCRQREDRMAVHATTQKTASARHHRSGE